MCLPMESDLQRAIALRNHMAPFPLPLSIFILNLCHLLKLCFSNYKQVHSPEPADPFLDFEFWGLVFVQPSLRTWGVCGSTSESLKATWVHPLGTLLGHLGVILGLSFESLNMFESYLGLPLAFIKSRIAVFCVFTCVLYCLRF